MNKQRTNSNGTQRMIQAGKLGWTLVWVGFVLAAVLGQSLYAVVLGAGSWSDELRESAMPAAAASYARDYVWELAELDRLDELGRFATLLERRLQRVIAGYLSEQWMAEQLDTLQAGIWDVFQGKRETLPPLDVSPLKEKLTAEVTRVIPYSIMQNLGWELVVPDRIDTMKVLSLDRGDLAEWRTAYERLGEMRHGLLLLACAWLMLGLAWHDRLHAVLSWTGAGLLVAALLLLALQAGIEQGSDSWARQLLAYGLSGQPPFAEGSALHNSVAHIVANWMRETGTAAASWAWRLAAVGAIAAVLGWISRRRLGGMSPSKGTGLRFPRIMRISSLVLGTFLMAMAVAVIL